MKDANAFGQEIWSDALTTANGLASGYAGLTDGSKAGDWRLPNVRELLSLVDYGSSFPALPAGHPFINVVSSSYWTSTTDAFYTAGGYAWYVSFNHGWVEYNDDLAQYYVWCVRGGK